MYRDVVESVSGWETSRMGNLEDEDGNRDNNKGREGEGGTTTTP